MTDNFLENKSLDISTVLPQQQEEQQAISTMQPVQYNLPTMGRSNSIPKGDDLTSTLEGIASGIDNSSKIHPEDNVYIPLTDMPEGYQRYDNFYQGLNNEELAYNKQGGGERFAKSVANMVPRFTHTLVESIVGPLAGTKYLLDGTKSIGFADNPFSKWLETWGQGYNIYESEERKNASWWSPTYWASANSLNGVLGTVGDLAAFYVTGKFVAGPLVNALTKPVGTLLGNNYNRAIQEVANLTAVIPEGQEGKIVVQELTDALSKIKKSGMADVAKMDASLKLLTDVNQRYTKLTTGFNKFQQAAVGTVTNLGMAQSSADQASEGFKQRAIQEIQNQGRTPTQAELDEIEEVAGEVATTTGIAMTVMGAVTLHGLLKGSIAKKEGEQLIRNEINAIEQTGTRELKIAGAKTQVPQYGLKPKVPYTSTTTMGKVGERLMRGIKATPDFLQKNLDIWPAVGFLEFGAVPASIDSYYNAKYQDEEEWTGQDQIGAFGEAIGTNVSNVFSKEGAGSFFTGLIAGNVGIGGGVWRKVFSKAERTKNTQAALKALNDTYAQSYLKSTIGSDARAKVLRKKYLDAIRNGDKDGELTLRQQQWENYLYPRIKYGLKSFVDKDIDGYRKLAVTDEGIRELQSDNLIEQGDNIRDLRAKFNEHLDHMQAYAENADKYYKALTLKYGGRLGTDGKPLYNDEHFEKLMVLSGGIDDISRRLNTLTDEIKTSKLSDKPEFQKRFAKLLEAMDGIQSIPDVGRLPKEAIKQINNDISKLSINPGERDVLAQKFADVIKLNIRKKQYFADYEDIIGRPELHKDSITENAVNIPVVPTGETLDIIHGNSPIVDGKKMPSKVEVGVEYYVQNKPTEGLYDDNLSTKGSGFSKFTIVSQEGDNIRIRTGNKEKIVTADYFINKKLAKVSEVDKNVPARFAMDHEGDRFIYVNPKVKLEGKEKTLGDIFYDAKDRQLKFRYRGIDGKIKTRDIDIKDTEGENPKLRFHDSRKELTPEELERIKGYKESAADKEHREKLIGGKLQVIDKLRTEKKKALQKIEDDILDHEIKIEAAQKQLAGIREDIEKSTDIRGDRKTNAFKKGIRGLFKTADVLGKTVTNLEESHKKLTSLAEELQAEIDYLDTSGIADLPNGRELLQFIDDTRKDHENVLLDIGKKINFISTVIDKARSALKRVIDRVLDYIDTFESLYPGFPHSSDIALRDFVERENAFAKDQGIEGYFEMNPDVFKDLKSLKDIIAGAEEAEIPIKEKDIKLAEQELEDLYKQLKEVSTQIKVQGELYDTFSKKLQEYELQQKRREMLNSDAARTLVRVLQGKIDQSYPPEVQPVDDSKPFQPAAKPIDQVFMSSVSANGNTEHDNFQQRYDNFLTNSNKGFPVPTEREADAEYIGEDPDYKKNLRVIAISRNNQHHYFSEEFISEGYGEGTDKVDNTDPVKGSLAYVYIYKTPEGFKFIDQQGKVLGPVGDGKADPKQVIFTRTETADTTPIRKSGFSKYYTEGFTPEAVAHYKGQAAAERAKLFTAEKAQPFKIWRESPGTPVFELYPKGHPQEGKRVPLLNSVVNANLVTEEQIGSGVIRVETFAGESGAGKVLVNNNLVSVPVGRPVLVSENNFAYLDSKKFYRSADEPLGDGSTAEVDHLFKVIKAMAENRVQNGGGINAEYTRYLKGVLHFSAKLNEEKGLSDNHFYIKADEDLGIVLAFKSKDKKEADLVFFTPEDIESQKELITNWLKQAYHSVDVKALKESGTWKEITKINHDEKGKLIEPSYRLWNSYENYLIGSKDKDGNVRTERPPLTTNIKAGGNPFRNKYIVPEFHGDYFPKWEPATPEEPKVEPTPKKKTAEGLTIKDGENTISVDGTVNKKSGKSTSNGNFSYDYTATLEGDRVSVKVDNFTSDLNKEASKESLAVIEKALSDKLTKLYKEQAPGVKEDVKPVEVKKPEPVKVEDTTATPDDKRAAIREKLAKAKASDASYMEVVPDREENKPLTPEEIAEFDRYIKTVSPQLDYETLPHVIKTGKGTEAWGSYKNHYIKLYEGAPSGTEYHEHYHAVEDSFLSPRQITDTRKEFRARKGSYVDRFGKTIKYAEATEGQIREKLAEEFKYFKKENPTFTQGSKIGNFFKRLVNFIKEFVFHKPTQIQDIFKRINSSYYRDSKFVKSAEGTEQFSKMQNMSVNEKKYIIQGMFERIIGNLRESNGGLVDLADGMSPDMIFEPVFKSMEDYYNNEEAPINIFSLTKRKQELIEADTKLTPEQKALAIDKVDNDLYDALDIWDKVTAEKENVIDDLKSFMRKFGLDFKKKPADVENERNKEDQKEQQIASDSTENKDRGYEVEYLTIDPVKAADLEIKLLFASLPYTDPGIKNPNLHAEYGENQLVETPSKLSPLQLPELVNGNQYMHRVLDNLSGIISPVYDPNSHGTDHTLSIQGRLFDMAKQDPTLVKLYNAVYKPAETLNDWRLRIAFYKFATKVTPDYKYTHIDENGDATIRNSNWDSDERTVLNMWESDLRADTSGLIFIGSDGLFRIDTNKKDAYGNKVLISPKGEQGTIDFLRQIQFPVTTEVLKKLSKDEVTKLMKEASSLHGGLVKGTQLKPVDAKAIDASPATRIARILAKAGVYTGNTSHNNMDNNRVQNHIMFNAITRMMADVNSARTLKQLFRKNPKLGKDAWTRNSLLLKPGGLLFDSTGKKVQENGEDKQISMDILEGMKSDQVDKNPNISTGDMNYIVRFMNTFNLNLEGSVANFIAADSKTEAGTTFGHFITPSEFKDPTVRDSVYGDILAGYLTDEINLIKEAGERTLLSGALADENYKKLQVFKDIMTPELVQEITDYANNPKVSTEKFLNAEMKKRVLKAVNAHQDKLVDQEMQELIDRKVLEPRSEGKYRWWGVNGGVVKKLGLDPKKLTAEQVKEIIKFRDTNLFIHLTEMRKLAFGPWYEVGDAPKRDKLLQSGTTNTYSGDQDFNKAMTSKQLSGDVILQPSDALYHIYEDGFQQLTVAEVKSRSESYPGIDIEEMDAQGICLDTHWKEYLIRSGDRWTPADEAQHQYDMAAAREVHYKNNPKETYRKELKEADKAILEKGNPHTEGTGTPRKPLGSGMQVSDTQAMPYADKTSIMRLTYPIAKERGLEDLYWFMHKNNIGMIGPKSWQKYGRRSLSDIREELPELYKIDGQTAKFNLDSYGDRLDKVKGVIAWNTFNKIVETGGDKDSKTRASQPLSLLTANSIVSGIPVDFWNPEVDDLQVKEKQWNDLSEADKRKVSEKYRMWDDHNKTIAERSYRGYEKVLDRFGISEEGGAYTFRYPEKIVTFLREEITRRDLPDNVAEGLDWVYDEAVGHDVLKYPLEALGNYEQLNNILWSMVDKEILSPSMNGTDNILTSSALMEGRGIRRIIQDNGKSYLASSELKFYEKGKGKNGSTGLMEVYAPNHLAKKLKQYKSQLTDRELLDYLNNTEEGQKLLRAVGFRIPTQGLNSMDAIKIKPWSDTELFLPAEMGHSVIVPSEIVTKVGADFDVDKMGTYHFNFYVDEKGYPRIIDFIEDTTSDEGLEKLYEQRKRLAPLDTDDLLGDTGWKTYARRAKEVENAGKEIEAIDKFIEENRGKDPWKLNSTEAIENKYFETMLEILTHPDNYDQLITPNSSEEMLKVFREISNDLNPEGKNRARGDINYSNLTNPLYLNRERQDYRDATGKSIGIGAQNNTFHAQSQLAYIPIDTPVLLPHKKVKYAGRMVTVLSGLKNDAGTYISDFISQIINGAVDAVKDKWLIEMLQDKRLLGTATFLGRLGAAPRQVFMFLNQPVIQEFVKQQGIYSDVKLINPTLKFKDTDALAKITREKLGIQVKKSNRTTPFTVEEMKDVLVSTGKKQPLTEGQKKLQSEILDEFIKYQEIADRQMLKEQVAFLTANMARVTDSAIEAKNQRVITAKKDSTLGVMKALDGKTFHSDILGMLNKAFQAKGLVTPVAAHPALKDIMEQAADTGKFLSDENRMKFFQTGVSSFIDYATQIKTGLNKYITGLQVDNKSAAARIFMDVKKQMKGDMKYIFDDVLRTLQPNIPLNGKGVKTIQLTRKPLTAIEADMITEALRTIRDNELTNPLYKQLVDTSFLQSGVKNTFGSYHGYIPSEDVIKFMRPVIEKMLAEDMQGFNDTMAMYRNNWDNRDIVPMARKSTDMETGKKYYQYFQPTDNGPKMLALHEVYDKARLAYPVIQTRDYTTDPITKQTNMKVRLFQKVLENGEPIQVGVDKKGNASYLYKQINAWGDGKRSQEYYDINKPSVLDMHEKITEVPDAELIKKYKTDTMKSVNKSVSSGPMNVQVKPNEKGEYNIYAGANENSILSNMAPRKFIYNGAEFDSVEQAFQESKLQYTKGTPADVAVHKKIAESTNAYDAKKFGGEYKTLDTTEWDKNSSKMMKIFIRTSLEQNPEVLKNLLATEDAKLTHTQDTGKWGKEFPRILMEIRGEFKSPKLFTTADINKVKGAKRDC